MSQLTYNPSSGVSTLLQLTVEYLPLPHHKQWYQLREYHWCDCQVTWGSGLPAHAAYFYSYYLWHSWIYSSNDRLRLGPSIITAWPVQKKLAHHGLLNWLPMVKVSTSSRTQCHSGAIFQKACHFPLQMSWACWRRHDISCPKACLEFLLLEVAVNSKPYLFPTLTLPTP